MTKTEKSLLLFLECRATDQGGLVDTRHMNDDDMAIAKRWAEEGFIGFGRVAANDIKKSTHWVMLSDAAWEAAHAERRARAGRLYAKRSWRKAGE